MEQIHHDLQLRITAADDVQLERTSSFLRKKTVDGLEIVLKLHLVGNLIDHHLMEGRWTKSVVMPRKGIRVADDTVALRERRMQRQLSCVGISLEPTAII